MLSATVHRRYALRQVIARAQWAFAAILVGVWALGIVEHAAPLYIAIAALGTAVALWQGVVQVRQGGVSETTEGIANRRALGYRRWRWDQIDRFTHVGSRVYVITREGKAWQLAGINEGGRNIWDDGETAEITDLLNKRLAVWRSSPGAAAHQLHGDPRLRA